MFIFVADLFYKFRLFRFLLDLKCESDEILKAIDKAVHQVDKYKSYVCELSDKHQLRVLSGETGGQNGVGESLTSSCSRSSSSSSLPRVLEFQIGEQMMRQSSVLGSNSEALSLIDENSTLLEA